MTTELVGLAGNVDAAGVAGFASLPGMIVVIGLVWPAVAGEGRFLRRAFSAAAATAACFCGWITVATAAG